ncbi:glutathione S-transferase, alpha tandem duplicate 1 [Tachysurus fulvidraco]|uniref:glutathione S-transferase, alpha tandem duplicate 1 n=1 Tax=Tachysurus fulvidraco TaxID=1234273 RepID=UPI000F4E7CC4|nr:glutathione S-transferase, alpha tandem duplicate 1 [Tachysurus fulvidraco]XP_027021433.1 glutathione S-transferase, alpha tandem duplicate 1 [Tachysurus fulvidraco]
MSGKVVLYYFNGRGKMESIRWLLAVAGVEFEEVFLTTEEQFRNLVDDGALLFHQVPLVEMDGMKLVQTKAILNYIAAKYNMYGKDIKERLMIDMYSEGARDIMDMIMVLPFTPADQKQKQLDKIQDKAKERSLPAYEKALAHSQFLVGSQLSCADVHLLEATLMLEELFPTILFTFPKIQEFQKRMKAIPAINKFLQPGSQRKPPPDEVYIKTVMSILSFLFK